ncbi:MAG TPA: PDZ domain-containing protein, partial [Planctomycetes bacterium]|nr:PDZ domain-containing protein [Planctomycetota bacterium]
YDAQFVGGTENYDLAVLLVEAPKNLLRPIPLGTSKDLQVGQTALAIGQPFGLDQTLSVGVISALGRQMSAGRDRITGHMRVIRNVIQTDAAINPGNSGGPLLDSAGRLVGVNSAIRSEVGQSAGIGFAIPVDTVNWVVPEIIAKGHVIRPSLGVRLGDEDDPIVWGRPTRGAYVVDVIPGGPADRAGLKGAVVENNTVLEDGDIITHLGGERIRSSTELVMALERYRPGQAVELVYVRKGKPTRTTVKLGSPVGK